MLLIPTGQNFEFTFVEESSEEPVNTEILLLAADGSDLPLDQVLDALADAISDEVPDVVAVRVSDRIAFVSQPSSINITGTTQVRVEGGSGVSPTQASGSSRQRWESVRWRSCYQAARGSGSG